MATTRLQDWILGQLETVTDQPRVVVRDPLRLLSEADAHRFASHHGYTVIVAATNLVFRELYERAIADPETQRLLVIDQAPLGRRLGLSTTKAPPPFYPDLLAATPQEARLDLSLQQFLKDATADPHWPQAANEPRYARLIVRHIDGVLRAYQNLRTAQPGRFTDEDFKTIVATAVLGVAEAAFKKLSAEDYWKVGLLGHQALAELDYLVPEVTKPIREELRKAPAPFRWFSEYDAETVTRAFYLAVVLAQHVEHWNLLIANVDPSLAQLTSIKPEILRDAAPKLIARDPEQAKRELEMIEQTLDRNALQLLLVDQLKVTEPPGFAAAIEKEQYSILIRSLTLLSALDALLSNQPAEEAHRRVTDALSGDGTPMARARFVERRLSLPWSHLKDAYGLARDIRALRLKLANTLKTLKVLKTEQLTFSFFWEAWNEQRLNRLEYYASALERLVSSGELLPRAEDDLPAVFPNILARIRQRTRAISDDVHRQLDELNRRFQDMVAAQYPSWVQETSVGVPDATQESKKAAISTAPLFPTSPILTSQFLGRCLKPHWDPEREKAVVLIFDGMRYDIWDELLRPMLQDRLELIADLPASSILPSETHLTRKAISAGTYPDTFDPRHGEDRLLKDGLAREFNYQGEVEVLTPEGAGTGETVRFRAGKLDVYIFELCDKELHKIQTKTLGDGRVVPGRPLAFVYQQHIKNIIDTEVMAIIRGITPGTKVFITADHGFGRVGRQPLWFNDSDLNEREDCAYLNCWLRSPIGEANIPPKVRNNIITFTPEQLRMPRQETRTIQKTGTTVHKEFSSIAFPRVGYAFSRQGSHYHPDAYSHGGISIQELAIPMVVMRVKPREEGLLTLSVISGPQEVVEGEDAEFRMRLDRRNSSTGRTDELRVEVEATWSRDPAQFPLPAQILYVPTQGGEVLYRFRPDPEDATDDERRQGVMERTLTIAVSYHEGYRTVRKFQTYRFAVRLNVERVIRRVGNLGNILGLTPKSLRS